MFSRWYSLFLGYLLLVFGIAGLIGASVLPGTNAGLITSSVIWLIVAVVSLWVGYGLRNDTTVRWYAGIVGGLLFVWGAIQLFSAGTIESADLMAATGTLGGLMVLLGSLGLAAATVPLAYRERRVEGGMTTS